MYCRLTWYVSKSQLTALWDNVIPYLQEAEPEQVLQALVWGTGWIRVSILHEGLFRMIGVLATYRKWYLELSENL